MKKKSNKKKSNKKKSFLASKEWKTLRDNHLKKEPVCVICGSPDKLTVHHILYRRGFSEHQTDPRNLVTLCKRCHYLTHKSCFTLLLADYLL